MVAPRGAFLFEKKGHSDAQRLDRIRSFDAVASSRDSLSCGSIPSKRSPNPVDEKNERERERETTVDVIIALALISVSSTNRAAIKNRASNIQLNSLLFCVPEIAQVAPA